MANALQYGQKIIPCYVLRAEIYPRESSSNTSSISTVDDRFRGKLHDRQVKRECILVPCWEHGTRCCFCFFIFIIIIICFFFGGGLVHDV